MWTQETQRAECSNLKKSVQMHEHYNSSFQGWNSPFLSEHPLPKAPPFKKLPPISENHPNWCM